VAVPNVRPQMSGTSGIWTLGVNSGLHDGSAALTFNGDLACMVETERVIRRKHAVNASPAPAIQECFNAAGIGWDDIHTVAVGWDVPRLFQARGRSYDIDRFAWWLTTPDADADVVFRGKPGAYPAVDIPVLRQVRFVPHHLAHAASGFLRSGLPEAAVVVADGIGEFCSTSLWRGSGGSLQLLRQWTDLNSLGWYYGFAAEWAGLGYREGGKLMGLASYGSPSQAVPPILTDAGIRPGPSDPEFLPSLPTSWEAGRSRLRQRLRASFADTYPHSPGDGQEPMAYANFAASVQARLEDTMRGLCHQCAELAGTSALVLAGGVASNCSVNGALIRSGAFTHVYVPPVPHDAGVSIGAADWAYLQTAGGAPLATWHDAAVGPPAAETLQTLDTDRYDATTLTMEDLPRRVAGLLVQNLIVCWFQGPSEVGQRALGQRSILANPQDRRNVVRVNTLKGRELWRPLAPSVHEDGWSMLFGSRPGPAHNFMLAAEPVASTWRARIPAVVHVDGTARPQIVRSSTQPLYAAVIRAFWDATGIPAVLNTSFNLAGEPPVYTAADALDVFGRSSFDALVIGDTVLQRKARPGLAPPPHASPGDRARPDPGPTADIAEFRRAGGPRPYT
jgi:carbamoyltransferase